MIPTAGTQRVKRTTTAPFTYENDGETVTTDIHIEFYARTLPQIRAQHRRNLEQSQMLEARELARQAMAAAETKRNEAQAAFEAAKPKDAVTAQQAVNDATRELIEAARSFGDRAKQVALVEPQWLSTSLADVLAALPDLEDPSGKGPFKITIENLETLSIPNLEAIDKAIEGYVVPKSPASE